MTSMTQELLERWIGSTIRAGMIFIAGFLAAQSLQGACHITPDLVVYYAIPLLVTSSIIWSFYEKKSRILVIRKL